MKIAVIGAGAMGSLFGSYLSRRNDVYLIGRNAQKLSELDRKGITVREKDGTEEQFHPHASAGCAGLPIMDLVIVFVKAMSTESALEGCRSIIGPETYLLTLQNGAGHERKLLKFADESHVIIGSTQHNSSVQEPGVIAHGGDGITGIGLVGGDSERITHLAQEFTACGIVCQVSDSIRKQIWDKLFINTAASSLTAVLQVPLGFILEDAYARTFMERLVHEAVEVANAEGFAVFSEEEVLQSVKGVLKRSKNGYTSIYTHVKTGQKTEVETISGYVIERAEALGIPVPYHRAVVLLIHALEDRNQSA